MSSAARTLADWLEQNVEVPPRFGPPVPGASGPLAALYRAFDGQLDGPPLIGAHRILALDQARAEKQSMDSLASSEAWEDAWWSPDWYPFASDWTGQLLVVDAKSGRVIEFIHDDDARPEIAPDLDRLFTRIWTALKAGDVVYDPRFGIGTPDEITAYHAARARLAENRPAPRPEGRPGATLALVGIPMCGVFALGLYLELDAGDTALGTTAVALVMTAVGYKLGWVV